MTEVHTRRTTCRRVPSLSHGCSWRSGNPVKKLAGMVDPRFTEGLMNPSERGLHLKISADLPPLGARVRTRCYTSERPT